MIQLYDHLHKFYERKLNLAKEIKSS